MNVLIIGNGGREHALAWRVKQSSQAGKVFVAPGNAGTHLEPGVENVALDPMDFPALVAFAKANDVALTIVGPEAPLVDGVVDYFAENGLRCFGPSKMLHNSKALKRSPKIFYTATGFPQRRIKTLLKSMPLANTFALKAPLSLSRLTD